MKYFDLDTCRDALLRAGRAIAAHGRMLTVLAGVLAIYAFCLDHVWGWVVDDAGISYAYAEHLADGYGLVAVPGSLNVEGYSNPLWVGSLALLGFFGVPITTAGPVLGAGLGLATILLGIRIVQRLEGRELLDLRWLDLTPVLLLGFALHYIAWPTSGLENALFTALLASIVLLDLREIDDPEALPFSALPIVGLVLTRPEGLMYGGLIGMAKAIEAALEPRYRKQFVQFVVAGTSLFGLYHLWHFLYFERLLANTYIAKAPGISWDKIQSGWTYLRDAIWGQSRAWAIFAPFAALGLFGDWRHKRGLVVALVGACVFVLISGGDWMPNKRFISYGLPTFAVLVHHGLRTSIATMCASNVGDRAPAVASGEALSVAALVGLSLYWLPPGTSTLDTIESNEQCHFCDIRERAQSVRKRQRALGLETAKVLTHDFGGFAWTSSKSFHPIDYLGLCDYTVARAIRTRKTGSPGWAKRHRYQYFFNEWGQPTTFIVLPNWWKRLRESRLYRKGYYELDTSKLAHVGGGWMAAVHRASFIDYVPDVDTFDFEPVTEGLSVLDPSFRVRSDRDERPLEVRTTIVPHRSPPGEIDVTVHTGSSNGALDCTSDELFAGQRHLHRQWERGEPYPLELQCAAPSSPRDLELGVETSNTRKTIRVSLSGDDSSADPSEIPVARDFPLNLPAPTDDRLRTLAPEVRALQTRRRRRADLTLAEPALAADLLEAGYRLRREDDPGQAYLAFVWARQADRSISSTVDPILYELRPLRSDLDFSFELGLLRRFYETGDVAWAIRWAAYLADRGHLEMARYVVSRLPGDLDPSLRERANRLSSQLDTDSPDVHFDQPIEGVSGDFERTSFESWRVTGHAFGSGPWRVPVEDVSHVHGFSGERIVNSYRQSRDGGTGTLTSPSFTIRASVLTFMVGGGRPNKNVAVELQIDGETVRSASGRNSDFMRPVFWELSNHRGERARIRIVDRGRKGWGHVVADRFRWLE